MDLIKSKGLKLQNILDKAMDEELEIESITNKQQKINQLTEEIEKLEIQKQQAIKNTKKHIDAITKNLKQLQEYEEKTYNKQINQLVLEKKYLKNKIQKE